MDAEPSPESLRERSKLPPGSPAAPAEPEPDIDLSRWRKIPLLIGVLGGLVLLIGFFRDPRQLGYSYLLGYMFFLSLCLGALFLVLVHHLFDASWSVPIRRYLEHITCAFPWMFLLFLPIAFLAPRLYPWMGMAHHPDHALHAKQALFNKPFWYLRAVLYFLIWSGLAWRLRYWSLRQDKTGSPECTFRMRRLACGGIFLFATTLTMAAVDWMKSLQHQWFSTMYGVYYFAGSVWTLLATAYVIALVLQRAGPLRGMLTPTLFYYLGSLMFAFTVFYAYIHFAQYFIIWNANIPEETFWYVLRERGTWWDIGMLIIFGHFALPFLTLLRIDVKLTFGVMVPLCIWAWLMHYADLAFNIMPIPHPDGFVLHWMDLAAVAFLAGMLIPYFLREVGRYPAYPLRDPRLQEALTHHEIPASALTVRTGELHEH